MTQHKIFPLLYSLVKALLVIPHSHAESKQLFSRLALFKTKFKSNLNGETLYSVLMVNFNNNSQKVCYDFKPTKSMIDKAKRATHLHEAVSSNKNINLYDSLSDFEEEHQKVSLNDNADCTKRSKRHCAKNLKPDFIYE